MVILIIFSFVAACILALVAYLQSEASWWKGPLASVALFALGVGIIALIPESALKNSILPPVVFLSAAAWYCAGLVGVGALAALILRRFVPKGRIVKLVFGGGWGLMFIGLLSFAS
ncbi:hypothetical protein [Pseudophaeobacter arcticus]|jgi:hypothetical protein|uniref:hypothetical protein n=1 Tax=Pseudophaeobacter arcticus TaxID=385492 RepID=UPI0039E4826D